MRIRRVVANNRKRAFEIRTSTRTFQFPYAVVEPRLARGDRIARAWIDAELGHEGFTFELASGGQGSVHVEQVLDYHKDPAYLREALLYKLTIEAQKRVAASPLSKREIIRRLGTSATQFYRLLDQKNTRKSTDRMLDLLHVLDCDVDLVVRAKSA